MRTAAAFGVQLPKLVVLLLNKRGTDCHLCPAMEGKTCSERCMAWQMSRMAPQRSTSTGEKFMREASGGRGQERMVQQQRPGLSGPHQSGPARAPLSPYSSGSKGQPSHRVSV